MYYDFVSTDFRSFMYTTITQIRSDIRELKRNLSDTPINQAEFMAKHQIKLPFDTVNDFEDFNKKIVRDKEFYDELVTFKSLNIVCNKL